MPRFSKPRSLTLTADHVARLARTIPDPGFQPLPGMVQMTKDDYNEIAAELIAQAPKDGLWVFAYGSLIWNPDFDFTDKKIARARGWHRAFCLGWDYRFRGNRDQPGVMLALDRGGSCTGVIFRLPDDALEANMHRLLRREMSMRPTAFPPRWIPVETEGGRLTVLTFAMNRKSGRYIGDLSDEQTADVLATACGFRGSMVEYLWNTVTHLEELGIHDRYLWRLQELTAKRIDAAQGVDRAAG
ncbi:gamma-glutamylcyclotransferase [Tianweitania sp. BSSL-BM11]|uniref:glutathione-specific gamma-glutamylcyclotransferase n=1 Tax=Tianweitania aestuarii TaxID=2814886 RepID=A0ABS5RZD0_9HYPH|nr:gamma-glutamylcyclotransferase [Tianweitania aestuarii]MBS9722415.1 gamma-glutamylcyclotransferase [Tianweitania aestuarii]